MTNIALGVDIGGTGIKTAPVDLDTGKFTQDRKRVLTPRPATVTSVAKAVAASIKAFDPDKSVPIGVAFPGVVQHGVVQTAVNLEQEWIGTNLEDVIKEHSGHDVHAMNDADAAGNGEFLYGAAHGQDGVILLVTLGTGIGTALIADGNLVANTELGQVSIDGIPAEEYAAESARDRHGLDWDGWIPHLQRYFSEMEWLLWPDLIIVGGGVSAQAHMFLPRLKLRAPIVAADLLNGAGIVGAAALAASIERRAPKDAAAAKKQSKKKRRK